MRPQRWAWRGRLDLIFLRAHDTVVGWRRRHRRLGLGRLLPLPHLAVNRIDVGAFFVEALCQIAEVFWIGLCSLYHGLGLL